MAETMLDAMSPSADSVRFLRVGPSGYAYHIDSNSVFSASEPLGAVLANTKGAEVDVPLTDLDIETALRQWDLLQEQSRLRPRIDDQRLRISQLAISPTLECNLNCTYCYNYQENEAAVVRKMPSMQREAVAKILTTLFSLHLDSKVNVAFIGGEPLLHIRKLEWLMRVSKRFAHKAGIKVGFLVTTNGLNLGSPLVQEVINRHRVTVSVSLDGPQNWHDEERKSLDGRGSYERIASNIRSFFGNYHSQVRSARATYKARPGRMLGTYRHLKSMGFNDIAMGSSDFDHVLLNAQAKSELFEEMEMLISEIKRDLLDGIVLRHSLLTEVFINLFVGNVKQVICGATRNHVAFDVYGRMQACHRYLGNTSYELSPEDINNRRSSKLVAKITAVGKTAHCGACWARSLCGGECYHVGKEISKQLERKAIQAQMCDFKRKAFDLALKAYIEVMEEAPEKMPKLVYG